MKQRMTLKTVRLINRTKVLKHAEKIILQVLIDDFLFYHKEQDGKILKHYAPSNEKLSFETDTSEATVKRARKRLSELGILKTISKKKGCADWVTLLYEQDELEKILLHQDKDPIIPPLHWKDAPKELLEAEYLENPF